MKGNKYQSPTTKRKLGIIGAIDSLPPGNKKDTVQQVSFAGEKFRL